MSLINNYPWWCFLLCLLLGGIFSAVLYYKDKRSPFGKKLKIGLAVLRFVSVSVIAFLLLSPLIRRQMITKEKPIIVVAQDNSSSLLHSKYADYYKTEYSEKLKELCTELSKDYDVQTYTFGTKVEKNDAWSFSEPETDVSALLDEVKSLYENRNLGAVLLATDGLYNSGLNPLNVVEKSTFPIYTLALGDTSIRKDLAIAEVEFNRIAYLGNNFPMEILVKSAKLKGSNFTLDVGKNGKSLYKKQIAITDNLFSVSVSCNFEADQIGLQRYTITLSHLENEITYVNNRRDVFVEVLDGRQKIALIAQSPHPDLSALKQSIESNDNYEIKLFLVKDFNEPVTAYNLLILHQLPDGNQQSLQLIKKSLDNKIPLLFILGEQTNFSVFNGLQFGLAINSNNNRTNESLPIVNKEFSLFLLSAETGKAVEQFPPLLTRFGNYTLSKNAQSVFYQKIGSVSSKMPLLAFVQDDIRLGFFAGEGIWRWRLMDFIQNGNQNHFNEIVNKTVQYLSVKTDKSRFRVTTDNIIKENEAVKINAELYNENYEPVNDPELNLTLFNEKNEKSQYIFNKTHNAYQLNIGTLPVGDYRYTASTTLSGKAFSANGQFTVQAINLEEVNLVADHNLLHTLAAKTGGKMLKPEQMDDFLTLLKAREDIKPVSYSHLRYKELLNLPLIFIFIILLLGCEWFLRKYNGRI